MFAPGCALRKHRCASSAGPPHPLRARRFARARPQRRGAGGPAARARAARELAARCRGIERLEWRVRRPRCARRLPSPRVSVVEGGGGARGCPGAVVCHLSSFWAGAGPPGSAPAPPLRRHDDVRSGLRPPQTSLRLLRGAPPPTPRASLRSRATPATGRWGPRGSRSRFALAGRGIERGGWRVRRPRCARRQPWSRCARRLPFRVRSGSSGSRARSRRPPPRRGAGRRCHPGSGSTRGSRPRSSTSRRSRRCCVGGRCAPRPRR